jgi:hypothetical protein
MIFLQHDSACFGGILLTPHYHPMNQQVTKMIGSPRPSSLQLVMVLFSTHYFVKSIALYQQGIFSVTN